MSAIIYYVTVAKTGKENIFQVTWANKEENVIQSFEQSASGISPEEMEWMWKDRRNQLKIGEKLFHFLDGHDHHFQQALKEAEKHSETLQIHLTLCPETANWPFELLAQKDSFLLPKHVHLVRLPVQKSIKEFPPQSRHLKLLFMACSPLDVQKELAFEQEEDGIFKATEKLAVDMDIEDTGSLAGLREKLEHNQYDIVHLSGYAGIDKKGRPFFVMESETGHREEVPAAKLWHEGLKVNPPRLLFLSGSSTGDATGEPESVFARVLVEKYHIPAVLGWGRWLSNSEANKAADVIYKDLTRGKSLLVAVQRARYELYNFSKDIKPSWPQLRLFSSGGSLGAIVTEEQKTQTQALRMAHVYLRNSEIKVLAEGFVGRRRQLQQSLHILKQDKEKVGILIVGTGGLGKSCLAGKISERFKEHTLISLHGKLNSISLKQALKDAFFISQDDYGKNVLTWEMEMKDIVGVLCRSCFKEKPYLILLDDFEQNLEGWHEGKPGGLLSEAAGLLKALLDNLPDSEKMTQMIITSRYGFSLPDSPQSPANLVNEKLELIWLPGFREVEQKKKVRALPHILKQTEPTIVDKLLAAGCGNPRLMEWLDVLVGELEKAKAGVTELLQAVSGKKQEFIQKHVINELLDLGGEELTIFLRWFAIYRRPVLKEGAREVGEKAGLKAWEDLLYRGMDLSLVEHDEARFSYQGTPLLREELLSKLNDHRPCHEAAFVYYKSMCEGKPDEQFDPVQTEEWIFHALECGEEDVASFEGSKLVNYMNEGMAFLESLHVGTSILKKKKQQSPTKYDASLLNSLAYSLEDLGEPAKAIKLYKKALVIDENILGKEHPNVAIRLNNIGSAWQALGKQKKAIEYFEQALKIWKHLPEKTHQDIACTLNNLGAAWKTLADYRKALEYYQNALDIDEALLGWEHPNIAIRFNNLGDIYRILGDSKKAIDYFERALKIDENVFGWEHPKVAMRLGNLGSAYQALGDYSKAISYFEQALAIDRAISGKAHPNVAVRLNNLGTAWKAVDKHRKAINCFEYALTIFKNVYGGKNQNVACTLNNLGVVWDDLEEHRKAINYYQDALTIYKFVFGPKHPDVANTLNNLGTAWHALEGYRKAIDYFKEALIIDETVFGRHHVNVADKLNNLGKTWRALDNHLQAIDYFKEALITWKNIYGDTHPQVAIGLINMGLEYFDLGERISAINYLEQALPMLIQFFEPNHPLIETVTKWLAKFGVSCKNQV